MKSYYVAAAVLASIGACAAHPRQPDVGGIAQSPGSARSEARPDTQSGTQSGTRSDVEEIGRGPIHEAFGTPIVFDPKPSAIIPREPPAPVEELPPEHKPAGNSVEWIPGYWNWDEDGGFIWVSGLWRDVPPERAFVPGYWRKDAEGWQRVSGYWKSAADQNTNYLPAPPASLETGPAGEPESAVHVWIPGCWIWSSPRYVWRPGYWRPGRTDWIWIPEHYVWTPAGCLFVGGYWDYVPSRRGVLFAPCRFRGGALAAGFVWRPSVTIEMGLAFDCWFARPAYCHYYFGDYYDPIYARRGFIPSFRLYHSRIGCDPVFAHRVVVERRRNPGFLVRTRGDFEHRVRDANSRPTRAVGMVGRADAGPRPTVVRRAEPGRGVPGGIEGVRSREGRDYPQRADALRRYGEERRAVERGVEEQRRGSPAEAHRRPSTRSPIVGPSRGAVQAPADRKSKNPRNDR